jgi:integrase
MINTLGDLISFVEESAAIPAPQKPYLRSALRRARALLGNGLADVQADPKEVLRQLDCLSPAMVGMTPQSLANLKSRARASFRYAKADLAPARSQVRLVGAWQELAQRLRLRDQRSLSRFFRFAQDNGCLPHDVDEGLVQKFESHLEHNVVLLSSAQVVRETRRAWNRAVDVVAGWPDRRLAEPQRKTVRFYLRNDQLPLSLRQELRDYLEHIAHPDIFLGQYAKAPSPETIEEYRRTTIHLASALAASGTPIEDLSSFAKLVGPAPLHAALSFLHQRAGNGVTHRMHVMALRARKIARHIGLPEQDLTRLDAIVAAVKRARPIQHGLAAKNRNLLEKLDDSALVDRLITLPSRLMQAALSTTHKLFAASYARDALAVELLLTCTMRVGNLVDLRLGESIRKVGQGRDGRWMIDIPSGRVKNNQPLRYSLPPQSGRLLEWYLANHHHYWCGHGSEWLFPGAKGGHVDSGTLSESIAKRARRYVGLRITCHQFRHIAADLYMREDPNGLGIVSQHLGHRDLNTTRRFYARDQTQIATLRYQEVIEKKRAAAPLRRKNWCPPGMSQHD